ncbi:PcfK-like family protein [Dysgonomonas sp. 25]|nr:PcfK-like family protein [Dysgonomonas sp. 25]
MKITKHFKNTIQAYLEQRAASDSLFEWKYTNRNFFITTSGYSIERGM